MRRREEQGERKGGRVEEERKGIERERKCQENGYKREREETESEEKARENGDREGKIDCMKGI